MSRDSDVNGHAGPSDVIKLPDYVWTRQFIKRPWPKTEDANKMVSEVAEIAHSRSLDDGFQANIIFSCLLQFMIALMYYILLA